MLATYKALLKGNRLEWKEAAPAVTAADEAIPVYVTILDEPVVPAAGNGWGRRMAAALEKLAQADALAAITDPLVWERETRQDRDLPDREP